MSKSILCVIAGIALAQQTPAQAPPSDTPAVPKAVPVNPPAAAAVAPAPPKPLDPRKMYEDLNSIPDDDSIPAVPNTVKNGKHNESGQQSQGPTVIHALDSEYFEDNHCAVFEHDVVLNNTSFNLICDKLTAYLRHGDASKPHPAATPAPTVAATEAQRKMGAMPENDALERAIAEGAVEVTQDKVDDSGNIRHSVGHGRKMVYDSNTGKITLSGKPDIQQGDQLCMALADRTLIVLDRNGKYEAIGPNKTVVKEMDDDQKTDGKTGSK